MKKITIAFISYIVAFQSVQANENPFFGKYQNQIALNVAQANDSFGLISLPTKWVPFNMIEFTYSQPTEFFRMPARRNLNAIQTIGYGKKGTYTDYTHTFEWDWTKYSTQIAYLSEDVSLYNTDKFYFGSGIGIGMQGQENDRIGTKLVFGFKVFTGYKISEKFSTEFFIQHFSNGCTELKNYSYNFWGLGLTYNF